MLKSIISFSCIFLLFSTLKVFSDVTKSCYCWRLLLITWCCLLHVGFWIDFTLPSEPPTFVKKLPSLVIVDEGSVLSLCCEALGSPPLNVEWSRARQAHSADTSLAFEEQGCLEYNPVGFNSNGTYVCRARNRFGLAETTTSVVVKRKGFFQSIIWFAIILVTQYSLHTNPETNSVMTVTPIAYLN